MTLTCFSQIREFEKYYPENHLFRKLQVKSVIDTIGSPSGRHYKKEFYTLCRQTALYYIEDSVRTYFKYTKSGDTLIRSHLNTINGREEQVYKFEKLVYNTKGKIELYQSCQKNYGTNNQTSQCEMSKFYYDEKGRLITKLDYSENKYKKPFSENVQLVDTLMSLVDVNNYWYDNINRLAVKKQMIGRPEYRAVDSFFYDKSNKLIERTSYQKQGYLGEFAIGDVTRTELIKYDLNKTTKTWFVKYSNWEQDQFKTTEIEIDEYIYYPNGLEKIWYRQSGDRNKSMLTYKVYEFY